MRIEALLETFWITGIAVLLVIVTMNPLARMLQLDNVIVVDGVIIAEMITISLLNLWNISKMFDKENKAISNCINVENEGDRVSYIIRRAWQRLKWNKWISILMIIEMILGMSVLVYAMNMYSSLVKEERRRANQSRDLCLEISGFNEKNVIRDSSVDDSRL